MGFGDFSRRRFVHAAALLGVLRARSARAGTRDDTAYDVVLESNLKVKTRDGVRLATDVYRAAPTTGSPRPP